uniref:Link domain-containing protein n=2 Tax=Poecilia mexicana TaxID=48701 RepID=A0A3B3WLC0_9TELE
MSCGCLLFVSERPAGRADLTLPVSFGPRWFWMLLHIHLTQRNMAGRFCFTSVFLLLFMLQLSASSLSKVVVQTDKPTGIFLLIDGGDYTLNFTDAQAACSLLNVTIATIAQLEEAVRHGLETCKYGWVAEKTAVIPRIKSDNNCGKGNKGLVQWKVPPDRKFAVYCFNASGSNRPGPTRPTLTDQNQTLDPSTASPQSPSSSTLPEALGPASSSAAPTSRSSTQTLPAVGKASTPQPTEQAPSAAASVTKTTDLSSSSSPLKHLSSHIPVSPHRLITSTPAGVTFSFPTSTQSPSSSVSSEPGLEPSVGSTRPLLDAAHISLISLSIVLLLLSATTAWWCYKSNVIRWYVRHHKDDVETEMWRNSLSEMDLHSEDGAAVEHDEELSTKYSSDVTLCVNTGTETKSAE